MTYTNARYHYQIDAPGPMVVGADGSASYVGPEERLQVAVVEGPRANDPAALARADLSSLSANSTGFKALLQPIVVTLSGQKVTKFVYAWVDGTSPVTGKPNQLTGARYYISKNGSGLAVVTYAITSSQYDPQGADDVASTFKWL